MLECSYENSSFDTVFDLVVKHYIIFGVYFLFYLSPINCITTGEYIHSLRYFLPTDCRGNIKSPTSQGRNERPHRDLTLTCHKISVIF